MVFIDRKKTYLDLFLLQTQSDIYRGRGSDIPSPSNLYSGGRRPSEKNLTTEDNFRGEEKMSTKNKPKVILLRNNIYPFLPWGRIMSFMLRFLLLKLKSTNTKSFL